MISFACSGCGKQLKVKDEGAGKKVKCSGCGSVIAVPGRVEALPDQNSLIELLRHAPGHAASPSAEKVARLVERQTRRTPKSTASIAETRTVPPPPPAAAEAPTVPPSPAAAKEPTVAQSTVVREDSRPTERPLPSTTGFGHSQPADEGKDRDLYDFLAPPQEPDELGRLGHYRVLKVLGAGGMGVVFLADEPALKRKVALKAMLPGLAVSESARQRFLREAQAAAAIEHDHIVPIFFVGEDRGAPFIAMPFLKGEPLDARLQREEALSIAEVLRIGREIAEGLGAAHAIGLIHRDIKPANVWLETRKGEPGASATGGRVKILDFGLARAATGEAGLTQQGAIIGTPAYMAPEQASGERVDGRCDLFSLGCVLYRMSTGQLPFKGNDTISTLMAVATENPPPPIQLRPELPEALSDLVMQLLAKKPEERTQTAQAVVDALRQIERETVWEPSVPGTPARRRKAAKSRSRLAWLAGGVVGVGVLVAALVLLWPTPNSTVRIESDDPSVEIVFGKPDDIHRWPDLKKAEEQVAAVAAKLKDLNPGFDGNVKYKREDAAIELFTDHVRDISPVRALEWLKHLSCPGSKPGRGKLADLSPLKGMKLIYLDAGYSQVSDLSPLKGMPLNILLLSNVPVSDFAALKDMKLAVLWLGGTQLSDLSPLKGMPLRDLICNGTRVSDLSPLKGMQLMHLRCQDTRVTDLSPLKGMPLKEVHCDFQPKRDAAILRSIKTLEKINGKPAAQFWKEDGVASFPPLDPAWVQEVQSLLPAKQVEAVAAELKRRNGFGVPIWPYKVEGGQVTEVWLVAQRDISPLRALVGLKVLHFGRNRSPLSDLTPLKGMKLTNLYLPVSKVFDLSPLKGMPLTALECSDTQVSDLSPLKGMALTILECNDTRVSDLSPLKGMKLTILRCGRTRVSDLSPLKDMQLTELDCKETKVSDLSPLKGMPLKVLFCDFKPERDAAILRSIKTLENINNKRPAFLWKEVDAKAASEKP